MRTKRLSVAASLLLMAGVVVPSSASDAAPTSVESTPVELYDSLPNGMLHALERDTGLTGAQMRTRLAREAASGDTVEDLEESLGGSYGGAWLTEDETSLTVAITDPAAATEVQAAGAQAELVTHSEAALEAVQATLNDHQESAPASVAGWYVDVTTNTVVVLAGAAETAAAGQFVAGTGVDPAAVQVEATEEQPQLLYDVVGGDTYFTPDFRCSVGFAVAGGFVTAGHCSPAGTPTSGYNQIAQGVFEESTFPGSDHAWVSVNQDWTPVPLVNDYSGGSVTVTGSQEAPIGSTVCRSGSTSGWHCGTVEATNQTVLYAEGTVSGLTRTSACADRGDSGGSFVWNDQAQGMTSGGSGSCTFGGVTYFQPVNPALQRYGLTLLTG